MTDHMTTNPGVVTSCMIPSAGDVITMDGCVAFGDGAAEHPSVLKGRVVME